MQQGLSFTVIEAPNPMDDPAHSESYDARRDFRAAHRIWLGATGGTDWLHDAIEADFGEDAAWYSVKSKRDATHIGASNEVATVVLTLMGLGALDYARRVYAAFTQRLADDSAGALLDWAREKARERRRTEHLEDFDGPPDFSGAWEVKWLSEGMASELADVLGVPQERLELVSAERRRLPHVMYAIYRDYQTGREYSAEVSQDSATFKPLP